MRKQYIITSLDKCIQYIYYQNFLVTFKVIIGTDAMQ